MPKKASISGRAPLGTRFIDPRNIETTRSTLLRSLETREKREHVESFDLDDALEEARRAPRTKSGDLWVLGDHRLLCGDATSADDVARLLDGAAPKLLTTDPPYGVSLDGSWRDGVYNALGPAE